MKKKYSWIYIIFIIFLIDFFSKMWILNYFSLYEKKIICTICNIYYTRNYGAAFSLLSNYHVWTRWFLSAVSVITIYIIIRIIQSLKKNNNNNVISYTFIIAGAIGNTFNRVFYGFVIDFIDLHICDYHFPTFNIADLSIFTGVIMILFIKYYDIYIIKSK